MKTKRTVKESTFVRSSILHFKDVGVGKMSDYHAFLAEYRRVAACLLDHYWTNGLVHSQGEFSIQREKYDMPAMLAVSDVPDIKTTLSGRAMKCLTTQLSGIIRSEIEKFRRVHWAVNKYGMTPHRGRLIARGPTKPSVERIKIELNSICSDILLTEGHFNAFISLKSFTNTERGAQINLPIRFHRQFNKWNARGERLNSFLFDETSVAMRFRMNREAKSEGKIVGCDQGMKTVCTLSDGQTTPKGDVHGASLEAVMEKLARKRKGSTAFRRAAKHRSNLINFSVNKLDLDDISEVRMEEIVNINFGRNVYRKMKHFTNTEIRDKLKRLSEESAVRFVLQSSAYRSQRCSCCGLVRKANRNGKEYKCACGFAADADLNAALNHEVDLPPIPFSFTGLKLNRGDGFYWKPEGLFNRDGSEITVPSYSEKRSIERNLD